MLQKGELAYIIPAETAAKDNSEPEYYGAMQHQGVFPMISYEDGLAAMDWLSKVFGFEERKRIVHEGRLSHGEMETGAGLIMLASPTRDYESPLRHRRHCEAALLWSQVPWVVDGVLVHVDNLDAHYDRSKKGGARILSEIQPGPPARLYRAEDAEGHRWMFMERQ